MADVRRRGYAVEDGEVTPGFASAAAAVHDHTGHPVAGVAVTFPAEQRDPGEPNSSLAAAVVAAVVAAARELEHRIHGHPPVIKE